MSEIIFPASPLAGQSFNAPNGLQYSFDGVKWSSLGAYSKNVKDIFTLSLAESFDGSKTTFTLQSNGENVYITTPEKATILLGGVLQEPTAAYTVNTGTSEITFASAPPAGTTFSGTLDSQAADQVVEDGVITNIKVASSAAIDGTKISPNFGSQNIVTSGTGATGNLGVTGNITVSGTVDGRDVATDGSNLDGI